MKIGNLSSTGVGIQASLSDSDHDLSNAIMAGVQALLAGLDVRVALLEKEPVEGEKAVGKFGGSFLGLRLLAMRIDELAAKSGELCAPTIPLVCDDDVFCAKATIHCWEAIAAWPYRIAVALPNGRRETRNFRTARQALRWIDDEFQRRGLILPENGLIVPDHEGE